MSRQLAISASFSVLAMAAFALFQTGLSPVAQPGSAQQTGAETEVTAPAFDRHAPVLDWLAP